MDKRQRICYIIRLCISPTSKTVWEEYINSDIFREISGMGIRLDRYLKTIPDYITDMFNEYNIPLINIPMGPSWMEIMNQLNVLVMNKNIRQFRIGNINPKSFSNLNYQSKKDK